MTEHADGTATELPPGGVPLTAFEEHMIADDRMTHPMVITVRLDFAGAPPPPMLAAAFTETLRREPLLTARVQPRRLTRPRWVPGRMPNLVITPADAAPAGPWSSGLPRLDPLTGPVLHAEVLTRADGWTLCIAAHHAATDGLGLVSWLERWLSVAAGSGTADPPPPVAAALAARGRVAGSWREFVGMLPGLSVGLRGIQQFVARQVLTLGAEAGPAAAAPGPDMWRPAVVHETLAAATTQALDVRARATGVTVNDLLVAAFVAAAAAAVADAPAARPGGWIRIAVPMSLRPKDMEPGPAVNRVSMVFLDRLPDVRHDWDALARGIRAEMDLIRGNDLAAIFPLTLEVSRLLPGGLERLARRPSAQCTAVVSNLGRCFLRSPLRDSHGDLVLGGSRLSGWWIVPPVRPGTAVAIGTHETAGRRTLALHFDPHRLTATAARRLLDDIVAALRADGP